MEVHHTKILRINRKILVENLEVKSMLDTLYQHGLINNEEYEELDDISVSFKAARKFLTYLEKKGPKAYVKFEEVLIICEKGFLVDKLRETDVNAFQDFDDVCGKEDKIEKFQEQLNLQTELLLQYKKDKEQLEKRVQDNEAQTTRLKTKYSEIEKIVSEHGIAPNEVAVYFKEYLNSRDIPDYRSQHISPLPSPSKTSLSASPSFTFSVEDIRANDQSLCQAIARDMGKDIVRYIVQKTTKRKISRPSSKYSTTMRRVTDELLSQHGDKFTDFIVNLQMDEINGYHTFIMVAEEIFMQDESNWGRVVVLYAFGEWMARHMTENGNEQMAIFMGDFLGFYAVKKLGPWIEGQGGWDAFINFFTEASGEQEELTSEDEDQTDKAIKHPVALIQRKQPTWYTTAGTVALASVLLGFVYLWRS